MQHNSRVRRRIKLIKPRFQLKLVGAFAGLSALGFMLQALHVGLRLSELSAQAPGTLGADVFKLYIYVYNVRATI